MTESTQHEYIGITIGPIYETISIAKKPASMWLASYMFSYVGKLLCDKIVSDPKVSTKDLISPHYEKSSLENGIGSYSDRIVLQIADNKRATSNEILRTINSKIIPEVKEEIAKKVALKKSDGKKDTELEEYIESFIDIKAVQFQSSKKDAIGASAERLDTLELKKEYLSLNKTSQIIRNNGKDTGEGNKDIKKISVAFGIDDNLWQLTKDESSEGKAVRNLKNVHDIAAIGSDGSADKKKIGRYFAVLQADGDNMGRLLKNELIDGNIGDLSKALLEFSNEAPGIIGEFGGVTIYCGGDDILALVPVYNTDKNETILDLTDELSVLFLDKMKNSVGIIAKKAAKKGKHELEDEITNKKFVYPTLSFGAAVVYHKFPLYEAFNESYQMLSKVKDEGVTENKDGLGISLIKHSGKQQKFIIEGISKQPAPNQDLLPYNFSGTLNKLIRLARNEEDEERYINGALHTMLRYENLLEFAAEDTKKIDNVFKNIFDEAHHKEPDGAGEFKTQYDLICELYKNVSKGVQVIEKDSKDKDAQENDAQEKKLKSVKKLAYLLRFVRFFAENASEEENDG